MAKLNDTKNAIQSAQAPKEIKSLDALLKSDAVAGRFKEVLGKKAAGFLSSILSAVNTNPSLRSCEPMTVVSSAMVAATLDLPINQSLGFAHIVPYSNRAQFQIGWRGLVQLAVRTGQYKTINVSEVYEGEVVEYDRVSGVFKYNLAGKKSDKVVGYAAYFLMVTGFEKWLYMTYDEVYKHGKKHSKSFEKSEGRWKQDFDVMAKKTVLKALLSKWAILSVELQKAITADQAIIDPSGEVLDYPDSPEQAPVKEEAIVVTPTAEILSSDKELSEREAFGQEFLKAAGAEIIELKTPAEVNKWKDQNAEAIRRLLPEHREFVTSNLDSALKNMAKGGAK